MASPDTANPDPQPSSRGGGRRPLAISVAILATSAAAIAVGLAIIGGGLGGTAAPSGTPTGASASTLEFADLSLVPVGSAAADATGAPPSIEPSITGSAPPSPSASPPPTHGVRATRIQIERLGIDLKIVEGDGVDAPIGKAAHYPGSAWPGGGSNIYVYGHAREGMFLNLWNARVGDTVVLSLVDGTTRTYVVDKVLPKVPWNAMQYTRPTAAEQLTLQTSTSYHPTSPRFIVIAIPAS